jgi:hypothetical protein
LELWAFLHEFLDEPTDVGADTPSPSLRVSVFLSV